MGKRSKSDGRVEAGSQDDSGQTLLRGRLKKVALAFVFLWFAIGGIAHFAATRLEMSIVPPFVPWPLAAVLVSGAFELLGAAGLLISSTRRLAGWGLFILTVAVTPANVYMLQRPDLFGIPVWVLIARLPLQVALLALILWSTRPQGVRNSQLSVPTD